MKLTLQTVRVAHGVFHQLAAVDGLTLRGRYRLYQLLRAIEGPVTDSDRILEEILKRHVERDDTSRPVYTADQDGSQAVVIRDPMALQAAQAEALAIEETIDAEPLKASELGSAIEALSPAALAALGPLFEWDGDFD